MVPERVPPATCALAGTETRVPNSSIPAAITFFTHFHKIVREDTRSPP
jgi:hypothetical protein